MKSWLVCIVPFLLGTFCTSQNLCRPPEIDFGDIVRNIKMEYMERDRIQYACNPGYDLEGSDWITCTVEDWTPQPKCWAPCNITKEQLDEKNLLLRGGQRHSALIKNGHTLEFMCQKGYIIISPTVRKCADGHLTLPTCTSAETGSEMSITGDMSSETPLPLAWNPPAEVLCTTPQIDNGSFLPVQTQYKLGDMIHASCYPGYTLEHRNNSSECTKYGWLPYLKCISKRCDYPHIENGALSWSNTYYSDVYFPKKEGETIHFRCNRGFLPENKKHWHMIRCTELGWDPEPKCFKQCIPPKHLPHGQVTDDSKNIFIEGDTISFHCDVGYQPEPQSPVATCTRKDWSPALNCLATSSLKSLNSTST
uniref:Complement factor H-like isoform X1 n=2 Tax=Pogona vitticeps TaxID=103695 RepID=A0A6J0VLD2_9SAUR